LLFALLLVQKGDWFNTLQFVFYGLFLLNFTAGVAWAKIIENRPRKLKIFLLILLAGLTLPGCLELLPYYQRNSSTHILIPQTEIAALNYLSKQPSGSVLTGRVSHYSLIPALSGKPTYLSDPQVLKITGLEFHKRQAVIDNLLRLPPSTYPADYFYLDLLFPKDRRIKNRLKQSNHWRQIFRNKRFLIFQKKSIFTN